MKKVLFLLSLSFLFLLPCFAQSNILCPITTVVILNENYVSGDSIKLAVTSTDKKLGALKLEYKWKVSNGLIEKGQGTSAISISTAGLENVEIVATVEIKGLPHNCPGTFSKTAFINPVPTPIVTGHSDDWYAPEMKQRIAAFYNSLKNYLNSKGVVINYGTRKETDRREAEIKKLIKQGRHDIKLIEFMRDNREPGIRTKFFLVPSGAKIPVPEP